MVKMTPLYILIILLIAALVFKCDNSKSAKLIHKTVRDTVLIMDTFHHESIKFDTIIVTDTDTLIERGYYSNSEYHYKINDSLLTGTIIAKTPFKPSIDFKYTIKSYTIKDSVYTVKQSLKGFYYGGGLSVKPLLNQMYIGVSYHDNKNQMFDLSIGRDFQGERNIISIGYKKRF